MYSLLIRHGKAQKLQVLLFKLATQGHVMGFGHISAKAKCAEQCTESRLIESQPQGWITGKAALMVRARPSEGAMVASNQLVTHMEMN